MTILFAGGGTGGHLYPAIAIAEEMVKYRANARIIFVGTSGKIEARVVPKKGFEFHTIWISGFSRRAGMRNLLFPVKVVVSLIQSFFLMLKLKPDVVVGTGGYVCGPVLFVASLMGIATVIHESNSYPGVTTRMLAARVKRVFITFDDTRQWLSPNATIETVGNPTREELSRPTKTEGCAYFQIDPDKKTVFVFGGSLGAASINAAMPKVITQAIENDFQVIWQTGEHDARAAQSIAHHANIKVMTFIERMDLGYAAADIVVCRSGATTLAELTRLGKPAILVPYPFAAANHQELNARTLVDAQAALMLPDSQLQEQLVSVISGLLHDHARRESMAQNSRRLGKPDAGKEIAEKILSLVS